MSLEMVHHNNNKAIKELSFIKYKTDHSMFISYTGLALMTILILSIGLYLTCKCKSKRNTTVVIRELDNIHPTNTDEEHRGCQEAPL